jgi:hypothetical protein
VRFNGVNAWANVPRASADLWPLMAHENDILVTMAHATEDTLVRLNRSHRYISY